MRLYPLGDIYISGDISTLCPKPFSVSDISIQDTESRYQLQTYWFIQIEYNTNATNGIY